MSTEQPSVPLGFCQCGCGGATQVSASNNYKGDVKGQHRRFIRGHQFRVYPPQRERPLAVAEGDHYDVDRATGCWIWKRKRSATDYGTITRKVNGRRRLMQAHRVSYELAVGPIPSTHQLHHICGNPPCVNPAHLQLVTDREHHRIRNGQVKLTWSAVDEIRRRHARGETQVALGRVFGVHAGTISCVVNHRTWTD